MFARVAQLVSEAHITQESDNALEGKSPGPCVSVERQRCTELFRARPFVTKVRTAVEVTKA